MTVYKINKQLSIPESEFSFVASRSSGPGGQHVNKVSTRITLEFNVKTSPSLSEEQKQKLCDKLASRLTSEGVLQISSQTYRSQTANKREAISRCIELLAEVLKPRKKRKPVRVSRAAKYARLRAKKHRSEIKKMRGKVDYEP